MFKKCVLAVAIFCIPCVSPATDCVVVTTEYQVCSDPGSQSFCQAACFQGSCRFNQETYHKRGSDNQVGNETKHDNTREANTGEAGKELDVDPVEFECILDGECECEDVEGTEMCRYGDNNEPAETGDNVTAIGCTGQ